MSENSYSEQFDDTTQRPHSRRSRCDTDDEDGLSEVELKNKLFAAMKNKGILDSMKVIQIF
jgi:hypothetical protein